MKYRLFLICLLLSGALPPEGEAAFSCREYFARLARSGIDYARQYGAELKASYGGRFLVRAQTPADEENERRLLQLWARIPPGEVPWTERAYRRALRLSPAESDPTRPRLDVVKTAENLVTFPLRALDHGVNLPVRVTTGYLHGRGLLEREYRLTYPTLAILTGVIIDRTFNASGEYRQHRAELSDEERVLYDYRLNKLREPYANLRKKLARAREENHSEEEVAAAETAIRELLKASIDELDADFVSYEIAAKEAMARIREAPNAEERRRFEREWARTLAAHPLFANLRGAVASLPPPERNARLAVLLTNRQRLYYRYQLITAWLQSGRALEPEKNPEAAAITQSPVYTALLPDFQQGKLAAGPFQRALMEDSYYELEYFARWRALGKPAPFRHDHEDRPTTERLTLNDLRSELLAALEKETGLSFEKPVDKPESERP